MLGELGESGVGSWGTITVRRIGSTKASEGYELFPFMFFEGQT